MPLGFTGPTPNSVTRLWHFCNRSFLVRGLQNPLKLTNCLKPHIACSEKQGKNRSLALGSVFQCSVVDLMFHAVFKPWREERRQFIFSWPRASAIYQWCRKKHPIHVYLPKWTLKGTTISKIYCVCSDDFPILVSFLFFCKMCKSNFDKTIDQEAKSAQYWTSRNSNHGWNNLSVLKGERGKRLQLDSFLP